MWLLAASSPIREHDKSGVIQMAHTKHVDSSWFGYIHPNETDQDFFYVVCVVTNQHSI